MPVLSNWNYVFLATGGWCVVRSFSHVTRCCSCVQCWSTLIAAILPKADKAPRAWLLNLAFFAVPIVFLGTVGSLYGLSEVNIIRAVNAGERALKTGDLRGLQSLASGMEDGLQYLKKANSVYSAFCWSMLLVRRCRPLTWRSSCEASHRSTRPAPFRTSELSVIRFATSPSPGKSRSTLAPRIAQARRTLHKVSKRWRSGPRSRRWCSRCGHCLLR